MNSARESFKGLLKANGFSITKPRIKVFEALMAKGQPIGMHDLVGLSVKYADRASVYRTVELFEKLGIVQRINIGWKYKLELSDKFVDHHHHLTCIRCGHTTAMNKDELEALITKLAAEHDFKPTAHQIEVQGYCAECSKIED